MVCWEGVWERAARQEDDRIAREIEVLRRSLYNDVRLPADALSTLLAGDFTGNYEARIAADGHDVEVRQEGGLWVVIRPTDILPVSGVRSLPLGKAPSLAQNVVQDAQRPLLALNPADPVRRDILREALGSVVAR